MATNPESTARGPAPRPVLLRWLLPCLLAAGLVAAWAPPLHAQARDTARVRTIHVPLDAVGDAGGDDDACDASAGQDAEEPVLLRSDTLAILDSPFVVQTHRLRRLASVCPIPRAGWTVPLVLLNVHDDENTSVEAALAGAYPREARLVEIRHTGARTLSIARGAERFEVDPNRIFTDAGAEATLARLSRMDESAHAAVRAFADTLLARAGLDTAAVVVTLHNNTEANYSARSYLPGADLAQDAAAVHLEPGADPDDFFYVTDPADFEAFRARGFNVVLQHPSTAVDDGSLSVLAGWRGQRYVNVEAQHGHVEAQRRMLEALLDVLTGAR